MFDKVKIGQVLSGEVNAVSVDNYLDNLKKAQALAVDVKEITELRKQLLDYVGLINTVLDVVREVSSASLNASDIEGTKSLIERLREEFPEQVVTNFLRVEIVDGEKEVSTDEAESLEKASDEKRNEMPVLTLNLDDLGGETSERMRNFMMNLLKQNSRYGGVPHFGHSGGIVRGPGTRRIM